MNSALNIIFIAILILYFKVELVCRKFVFDVKKDADIRAFLKVYAENIRKNGSCLG